MVLVVHRPMAPAPGTSSRPSLGSPRRRAKRTWTPCRSLGAASESLAISREVESGRLMQQGQALARQSMGLPRPFCINRHGPLGDFSGSA